MENQERHSKKIDLLAKCLEAGLITLQEALFILDADVVPEKSATTSDPGHSRWNGTRINPYPYTGTQSVPLTGTIMGGTGITTSNFPINTSVTYTSTSISPGETLTMHAHTVGSQADTKQE